MSRDQRPGKIKLVTTAKGQQDLHERFEEESISAAVSSKDSPEAPSSSWRLQAGVFFLACAIGGAGIVLLPEMIG